MEPAVYRIEEFCERYAISRRSFYREIAANRLRFIKRGKRTLIIRDDAEAWFQEQQTTVLSSPIHRKNRQETNCQNEATF